MRADVDGYDNSLGNFLKPTHTTAVNTFETSAPHFVCVCVCAGSECVLYIKPKRRFYESQNVFVFELTLPFSFISTLYYHYHSYVHLCETWYHSKQRFNSCTIFFLSRYKSVTWAHLIRAHLTESLTKNFHWVEREKKAKGARENVEKSEFRCIFIL